MNNYLSPKIQQKREADMSLVKIKRFAQVTLPPDVRKKFNLNEGDYLEAEAVEEGILLKPVTVVERKKAWNRLFEALDSVEERKPKPRKNSKKEEEEIARMVKDYRKHRHG
jgi:AbrB family looped-hinge helix DNA binding protein